MGSHTYRRVMPRDLFNEANLLKCYGALWIALDNLHRHNAALGDDEGDHGGGAFEVVQDENGGLTLANVPFTIRGEPWSLRRPLNSREPWPLYAETEEDCVSVFNEDGTLSAEFLTLITEATSEKE